MISTVDVLHYIPTTLLYPFLPVCPPGCLIFLFGSRSLLQEKDHLYCARSLSNNAGCNWDKGDCCGPLNNYDYCKACKVQPRTQCAYTTIFTRLSLLKLPQCLDCTFVSKGDECVSAMKAGCGSPKWKGDNNCDDNK